MVSASKEKLTTGWYTHDFDSAAYWESCWIDSPLEGISPVLSEKDRIAQTLADFNSPFTYETLT